MAGAVDFPEPWSPPPESEGSDLKQLAWSMSHLITPPHICGTLVLVPLYSWREMGTILWYRGSRSNGSQEEPLDWVLALYPQPGP